MTARKTLIGGLVGALALGAAAQAADMPGSWLPPGEPIGGSEYLSGWYLRGDIGYRYNNVITVESNNAITSDTYSNALGLSFGAGYKYYWFRADVTVDHGAPAQYTGTTALVTTQPQYTAKIDSISALGNVYFDLGTWAGITPYVGGGVGASYLRAADYHDNSAPPAGVVPTTANWSFSWAAMAGVSYRVMPNWVVDVGYRYLHLGSLNSGVASNGNITTWKDLSAQEVRIGFRFLFD